MLKKFLFSTLILFAPLCSEIIESDAFSDLTLHVGKESLTFVNISSTLYEPQATFAQRKWCDYFFSRAQRILDGEKSEELYNKIKSKLYLIPKKLVEESTSAIILALQENQTPIFGITEKRLSPPYAENFALITSNHLKALDIDFEKTHSYFSSLASDQFGSENASLVYGILFANGKQIGTALHDLLEKNHYKPSKIVVMDDSLKCLKILEEEAKQMEIPFTGLRYSRSDARKSAFDQTLGTIQFLAYVNEGKILTDEEALKTKLANEQIDYESLLDELIPKLANNL